MSIATCTSLELNPTLIELCRRDFPHWSKGVAGGLLCHGGDLSAERLLAAYASGIFPWYNNPPILWWAPSPRCVLLLQDFHLPKRSLRYIKQKKFTLTINHDFAGVVEGCAGPRDGDPDTWITPAIAAAYGTLHGLGYVHSIETWQDERLVGGLYGVGLGDAFFGESMFHIESEASRFALFGLVQFLRQRGALFCDCQQKTEHMLRAGATMVSGANFQKLLEQVGLGQKTRVTKLWEPWKTNYTWDSLSSSWRLKSK
ncbi:MAG: leucyl/phenylalanyl-tRNA--protein transferase [Desulfovibrionaceae bacterium]|nr:leucyl/phenylalanyl-tRNA--protein transferase [Desulfovibrionaceae bacterium]